MLRAKRMDVVAYWRSDHEEETYYLVRSYSSLETLKIEQNAFYGSDDWKLGPRIELVDRIETYLDTLIWSSDIAVASMRELNNPA